MFVLSSSVYSILRLILSLSHQLLKGVDKFYIKKKQNVLSERKRNKTNI